MTTLERVKHIVAHMTGTDEAKIGDNQPIDDAMPEGLALDSLDRLHLVVGCECEFGVEILDSDVDKMEPTCAALAAAIERKMAEAA